MYFKLLPKVGNHAQKDPKTGKVTIYKSEDGCVIESDSDLVKKFPGKFERVKAFDPAAEAAAQTEEEEVEEAPQPSAPSNKKPAKKTTKPKKSVGKDVTEKFPEAKEEDFKVFLKGSAYVVTEADDPSVPLNKKLLKKKEVMSFIKEYLEE